MNPKETMGLTRNHKSNKDLVTSNTGNIKIIYNSEKLASIVNGKQNDIFTIFIVEK